MNREYKLEQLKDIATEILKASKSKVLLFYGDMGSGKTTLIKTLCALLGSQDEISSPTFSLVNEYKTFDNQTIFHFDFYRIENEEEAYDMGIEDYFYSDAWCFIEWPEHIENLLPLEATIVQIAILDNGKRQIQLK